MTLLQEKFPKTDIDVIELQFKDVIEMINFILQWTRSTRILFTSSRVPIEKMVQNLSKLMEKALLEVWSTRRATLFWLR